MAIIKVTSENFEAEVLNAKGRILVDFYADWCGPCKMLSPILEKIGIEHPEKKICKINVDESTTLAQKYGVMSIPCLILFDECKEIKRNIGFMPEAKLKEFIK